MFIKPPTRSLAAVLRSNSCLKPSHTMPTGRHDSSAKRVCWLRSIIRILRRVAPDAEIITLGFYNPFAIVDPTTNLVVEAIDQRIQEVSAANRANLANPFAQFNLVPPQPQTLCTLSLVCLAPLHDIHPTDLGYQAIADVMWAVSGYTRFEH